MHPPMPKQRMHDWCPHCGARTEACQYWKHRGTNRCMECNGGVGNRVERYCGNCLDLPFREQREELSGEQITYTREEPPEES